MYWYDWIFWAVWIAAVLLILAYGFVIPFGAPFLPTMKKDREEALNLLDLKPGQLFIDLGSGDGSLLVLAAQKGLRAEGYEINPFLWLYSWGRTRRYGGRAKVKLKSFWRADLNEADGVFVFLIGRHMEKLAKLIDKRSNKKSLKVVSHAFAIPGRRPSQKVGALFLYIYN